MRWYSNLKDEPVKSNLKDEPVKSNLKDEAVKLNLKDQMVFKPDDEAGFDLTHWASAHTPLMRLG
jgi:hypothetical protein